MIYQFLSPMSWWKSSASQAQFGPDERADVLLSAVPVGLSASSDGGQKRLKKATEFNGLWGDRYDMIIVN